MHKITTAPILRAKLSDACSIAKRYLPAVAGRVKPLKGESAMKNRMFKKISSGMLRAERGMVTAEYALGTVATTGIAGILIWLAKQEWFRDLIVNIFRTLLSLG